MLKNITFKLVHLVTGETVAEGGLPEIEEKTGISFDDLFYSMKFKKKIQNGSMIVIKICEGQENE